jgi:hypothetical protein
MKKIIAFMLAVCVLFSLTGCSGSMTSAERFLLAVKKMDFAAMKNELVPDETFGSFYLKLDTKPEEDSVLALRNLYALIQYSIGEISEENADEKTVEVTLKTLDAKRICDQTRAKVMASAKSAEQIVGEMISDGSVAKTMMTEGTFTVKMKKTDGEWKIPFEDAENKAFAEALAIDDMIDFFIKY